MIHIHTGLVKNRISVVLQNTMKIYAGLMFFFFGGGILRLNESVKNKKVSEKILENYQYKSAPNLTKSFKVD